MKMHIGKVIEVYTEMWRYLETYRGDTPRPSAAAPSKTAKKPQERIRQERQQHEARRK